MSYQFNLYPNNKQKNLLRKSFGCYRVAYNESLAYYDNAHAHGRRPAYAELALYLKRRMELESYKFLAQVYPGVLEGAIKDLKHDYDKFIYGSHIKPQIRTKNAKKQVYKLISSVNDDMVIEDGHLKIPGIGFVKIKCEMQFRKIRVIVIERCSDDTYSVFIN